MNEAEEKEANVSEDMSDVTISREEENSYQTEDGVRMTRETNDKAVSDSANMKLAGVQPVSDQATLRALEGHDKTLREADRNYTALMEQNQQLFSNLMSEKQSLFSLIIGALAGRTSTDLTASLQALGMNVDKK